LIDWDTKLSLVRFAYNRTNSCATSHSPFEVCYGLNHFTSLDLITIPQESKVKFEAEVSANEIKKFHGQVRAQIEKVNEQYKSKENKNMHPR